VAPALDGSGWGRCDPNQRPPIARVSWSPAGASTSWTRTRGWSDSAAHDPPLLFIRWHVDLLAITVIDSGRSSWVLRIHGGRGTRRPFPQKTLTPCAHTFVALGQPRTMNTKSMFVRQGESR